VTFVVSGLRDVTAAFAVCDRETRLALGRDFRLVAEPVRRDAESLAIHEIRNMPLSPEWAKMRVGATRTMVYVAPKLRGLKGHRQDPRRRPKLATLMMERAMEPALNKNEPQIERATEALLERVTRNFNQ